MKQLNPYLTFDGNCREAMNFYKECLGAELEMQTHGESPMAAQAPVELKDKVMHSSLKKDGKHILMAADTIDPAGFTKGNNISVCIACSSKEEIEEHFAKLSAGGKVNHPLKEEFFGMYAQFEDKYGIGWMLQFSPENNQ